MNNNRNTKVVQTAHTIAAPAERITFTDEQVALIRSQVAPNAKPDELALFLYQCRRTGLDPLARQMYCIHRGGKMTIQTSIDGFRVVAERSGDYGGQDAPEYMHDNDGRLVACRVAVYRFRGDQRYLAAVGVAYMSEYNAGGPMWQKMPHTMLAKCAEAQALRKAYPQDLSGIYTSDEMMQADVQATEDAHIINETQPAKVSAYKQKYEKAEEIANVLEGATDIKDVANLYYINAELIETSPQLKEKFSEKKNELFSQSK